MTSVHRICFSGLSFWLACTPHRELDDAEPITDVVEQRREQEVLADMDALCRLLSRPSPTVAQTIESIGEMVEDQGASTPIIVRPDDSRFPRAWISRAPDRDEPRLVTLQPASDSALTVAGLRQIFGDYAVVPRFHPEEPLRIIFYADYDELPHQCAIIASVARDGGTVDEGKVVEVAIRRDRRS